jgi:hypothetical protein
MLVLMVLVELLLQKPIKQQQEQQQQVAGFLKGVLLMRCRISSQLALQTQMSRKMMA